MLTIRSGNLEHLPAVLALLDEAVAWLVARGQTGQWGTEPWSERPDARGSIRAMTAEGELWLAETGGEPVGALIVGERPRHVHPAGRPELYVNLLVTSRRHAGEGIGARLVRTAVERAQDKGVDLLRVDCWAGSPKLVGWYESQGFRRSGTFELRGWRGQVFEMELRLPPGVAPGAVGVEKLLAHTDDVAVVLGPMFAWPTGVRLTVWLRVRHPESDVDQLDFHLGVECSDDLKLTRQGGGDSWNYWLWPLPPDGPLTFVCAWPSQGLPETKAEIDAAPLREAAGRAVSWAR